MEKTYMCLAVFAMFLAVCIPHPLSRGDAIKSSPRRYRPWLHKGLNGKANAKAAKTVEDYEEEMNEDSRGSLLDDQIADPGNGVISQIGNGDGDNGNELVDHNNGDNNNDRSNHLFDEEIFDSRKSGNAVIYASRNGVNSGGRSNYVSDEEIADSRKGVNSQFGNGDDNNGNELLNPNTKVTLGANTGAGASNLFPGYNMFQDQHDEKEGRLKRSLLRKDKNHKRSNELIDTSITETVAGTAVPYKMFPAYNMFHGRFDEKERARVIRSLLKKDKKQKPT